MTIPVTQRHEGPERPDEKPRCTRCGCDLPHDPDLSHWGFVCTPCHAELPDIGGG